MPTAITDFQQKLIPLIKNYVNYYNEHKRLSTILHPTKQEIDQRSFYFLQVARYKYLIHRSFCPEEGFYPEEKFTKLYNYQGVVVIFTLDNERGWSVSIEDDIINLDYK